MSLSFFFFFAVVRRFNSHACNPLGKSCMIIRRCRQRHLDVYTILKGKKKQLVCRHNFKHTGS